MRCAFALMLLFVWTAQAQTVLRNAVIANMSVSVFYTPTNSEVVTYKAAIVANGGTIQDSDLSAVDGFVGAEKSIGHWSYWTDMSPLAGDTTNASVVKLVSHPQAQVSKVSLASGMTSANYAKSLGFYVTNGGYLWPGLVVSNSMLSPYSNGACIWITGTVTNSRGWFWGTDNVGSHEINYRLGGNNTANGNWQSLGAPGGDGTLGLLNVATLAISEGMIGASRVSLSSAKEYINGRESNNYTDTIVPFADSNYPWLIGARYSATAPPAAAGTLYASMSVGFYGVDDGSPLSMQTNVYNNVRTLMIALGRSPARTYRRPTVIISGQSNSYGEGGDSTSNLGVTPFGNLVGGATAYFFNATANTNFFTLRTKASEYVKYSGWMAMADEVSSLSTNAGWGATNDLIYESFGKNGINIGSYSAGTVPYTASTNWATNQNILEKELYNKSLKYSGIFIVGGESDGGNAAYGRNLYLLQTNYQNDLNLINSDSATVPIFFSQHTAYATGATPENIGMLTNHEQSAGSGILVMPKYQMSYGADHIHMDNYGYMRMGEQYGMALFRILTNGWFEPLRPTALALVGTTQISVTFTGIYSTLVLDTTSFWWLTNKANYGFSYSDSGSSPAITTVAISATNKVLITVAGDISGNSGRTLTYAINSTTNSIFCAGTPFTPGGNLRDDNPAIGFRSGSNLWNHCVVFSKTF